MTDLKQLFGRRLKELRKEKHLTLEQMSERIGIDVRNLIKIENAQTFPRYKTLENIIKTLNLAPSDLFYFEHLQDTDKLKEKIIEKLNSDKDAVKFIYKILF